eukprot:Nk52_evm1s963 gene=Nk52_evmTU1s963
MLTLNVTPGDSGFNTNQVDSHFDSKVAFVLCLGSPAVSNEPELDHLAILLLLTPSNDAHGVSSFDSGLFEGQEVVL